MDRGSPVATEEEVVSSGPRPGPGGPAAEESVASRHPGGRHLDADRDEALCEAALDVLADVGYDRLTMEAVAARARAGKATIYRRWTNKAALVADALGRLSEALVPPDTGSLRGDLLAMASGFCSGGDDNARTRIMVGLVTGLLHSPDLRAAMEGVATPPERKMIVLLERAQQRGELRPGVDIAAAAAVLPAMSVFRFLTSGEAPDVSFASFVVDNVLLPMVADSPSRPS